MKNTIIQYLDYQEYLREWYRDCKKADPSISYQKLADTIGINSKSYLYRVFTGEGRLTHKSLKPLLPLLKLGKDEVDYLKLLITLKHAKSDEIRESALKKIEEKRSPEAHNIASSKIAYFKKWYHVVIRELVCSVDFENNFQKLGRMLSPAITSKEAHDSVKLLLALNLIDKNEGQYVQTDAVLMTTDASDLVALRSHQKYMMDMGKLALSNFSPDDRNIVSCTAGVSEEGYAEINTLVNEFQNKLSEILQRQQTIDTACQLNIQLFPLTKKITTNRSVS